MALMDDKLVMLRHFLAGLAYRTQKALRGVRTILDHLGLAKMCARLRNWSAI